MAIPLLLLNPYVDAILAIALGICIGGIMNSLKAYIARIPWVGGAIADAVGGMAQAITNAGGLIIAPISDAVGGTLHGVARLIDWTYGEFRSHARLLLQAALLLPPLALAVAGVRALVHRLTVSHTGQAARIKTLEREYHGIEHQVKVLEREFHGIDETGIRKKLATLDNAISTIESQTIPAIRSRVAADEGAFAGLESWLGIKVGVNYKDWAIALAGTLLGAVGLDWLRCRTNLVNQSKNPCGAMSDLSTLLGLFAGAFALANLEEIVKGVQVIEVDAVKVMTTIVGVEKDLFG